MEDGLTNIFNIAEAGKDEVKTMRSPKWNINCDFKQCSPITVNNQ